MCVKVGKILGQRESKTLKTWQVTFFGADSEFIDYSRQEFVILLLSLYNIIQYFFYRYTGCSEKIVLFSQFAATPPSPTSL